MVQKPVLQFGFSPCPNDTFAFWAAVHGEVDSSLLRLAARLHDIEQLNQRALDGHGAYPVTKLSLPALARVADRYAVLPAGAALGFGNGPLLVVREASPLRELADLAGACIAIPGALTTAALLLACLCPATGPLRTMHFAGIMAAVASGEVDAGLVIHEGRFTYQQHGLRALADLGALWQRASGAPLPLGVIAASRDLPTASFAELGRMLRESVRLARRQPALPRSFVRHHAQELSDEVCDQHIALYVNEYSEDLGSAGRRAIESLLARARQVGFLPPGPAVFRDEP